MSIGYRVINAYAIINGEKKYYIKDGKYDWDIAQMIDELKLIKYLEKLTLYEISFTGNPANPQARILGIKKNRRRVDEGMEVLEMPNFKTKSEFQMALEGIKNADGTLSDVGLRKMLQSMKKAGKLNMSHNQIEQFVKMSCVKPMNMESLQKTLDNKNIANNEEIEALVPEPLVQTHDISPDVKTQTPIPTWEEEFNNYLKS
jgi:hypothetical protein